MKKKRMNRAKVITVVVIAMLDILFVPYLLYGLFRVLQFGLVDAVEWFSQLRIFNAIYEVATNPFLLGVFGFFQLFVIAFLVFVLQQRGSGNQHDASGFDGPPPAGNGEHGSARWMTEREVSQKTLPWKLGDEIPSGGIVMGVNLKKDIAWVDPEDRHTLIVGTTRSGKSRRIMLPTIWHLAHAGESMIITDPKGELYERTNTFLKSRDYETVVIDFRKPGWGNRWNALHPVYTALDQNDISTAAKHAWSIAHMFVYQKPGAERSQPIWNDGAESVIASLILAVASDAPDVSMKHMPSVYKTLAELGEAQLVQAGNRILEYIPLTEYMKSLPMDHPARDAYATARLAPEKTRGSFFTTVASLLRLFSDPSIQHLTSVQDHDLKQPGYKKTAVFLIIPDEDKTRHPLAALYCDQAYQALVDLANDHGGRLPVRTNFLSDEWGNMPSIKDFDTKLTVSGGRGIRWHLIVQDFAQINAAYGPHVAKTIRGNCHNLIYLLTTDIDTAEEISKRCGRYTIRTEGSSYTVSDKVSTGQNQGLTGRYLRDSNEILKWPEDWSLVLMARNNPAKLPLPDLSMWPIGNDLDPVQIQTKVNVKPVPIFIPEENHEEGGGGGSGSGGSGNFFLDEID